MAELNKVIKGLEHCQLMTSNSPFNPCHECPYKGKYGCAEILKREALELLKEYKQQDGCPCTHCMEWECDEVCDEYKKWRDT